MLELYRKQFLCPGSEFSPFPFWFWNDTLDKQEIERQIGEFKKKGIEGFVIHPRMGLPNELDYLSDEFMDYVKCAVQYAQKLDMKVILYDEAMYPSGSAHGQVVHKHAEYASKGLKMMKTLAIDEGDEPIAVIDVNEQTGERMEGKGKLQSGFTRYFFMMTYSEGTIRGIHYGEEDWEADAPKSADLLNPLAVNSFIQLTHERYYECLGEYFGNTIIAMFTDEPNILGRCGKGNLLPWTNQFLDYYIRYGGKQTDLPLLFDEAIECEEKSRYKRAINSLLGESFYKQLAKWCKAHHIGLTGHPENSQDIGFLQYFDIPCQDIVWRYVAPDGDKGVTGEHSTMGKCSSDSARHRGKLRNGNECFGCCSLPQAPYTFSREDMKWYLDWLFVRGVNLIIPHAFFYSIRDQRKAERPPDVGMNSEFWGEYQEISDYIKRMSQLLVGSTNKTSLAILCTEDKLPWEIAKPLFENQIEFNYLEEELLGQAVIEEGTIKLAKQRYHVLLIDQRYNYNKKYNAYLKQFEAAGGVLIYTSSEKVIEDVKGCLELEFTITPNNKNLRATHLVKEGAEFILLTNEGEEEITMQFTLRNNRVCELWEAEAGTTQKLPKATNVVELHLERRKSLILVLEK